MNIILAETEEFDGEKLVLRDHRAKHIVKVLGSEVGDTVKCGKINGPSGKGTIVSIERKFPFYVELRVDLRENPVNKPAIDLLLALPRPIMLKRILSQATSLGVGTIHILNANRVEKSFWDAGLLESSSYREHLIHGLEQAVDTRVPHVEIHRYFKKFVEETLPKINDEYSHLLLAHPGEKQVLKDRLASLPGRILLAVGPEGGWVDYEVQKLKNNDFKSFSIGQRILKVDTAVVSLHSRISAHIELFSSNTRSGYIVDPSPSQ